MWSDLLTLVRIDKQKNELPVIASHTEEQMSHLIMRLRLEQAQSVLLMRDTPLFRERIEYALQWLDVFDGDSEAVSTLRGQLNTLLKQELKPELPTIGEAHRRLRDIVAQRSRKPADASTNDSEAAADEAKS